MDRKLTSIYFKRFVKWRLQEFIHKQLCEMTATRIHTQTTLWNDSYKNSYTNNCVKWQLQEFIHKQLCEVAATRIHTQTTYSYYDCLSSVFPLPTFWHHLLLGMMLVSWYVVLVTVQIYMKWALVLILEQTGSQLDLGSTRRVKVFAK